MKIRSAFWLVVVSIAALWVTLGTGAQAEKPLYAKHARAFDPECEFEEGGILPTMSRCRPIDIPSPNGKTQIQVVYGKPVDLDGDRARVAHLEIAARGGARQFLNLPEGFEPIDLEWSPDSKAFFINGGNGGAYWGFWVWAYSLDGDGQFKKIDVMKAVWRNMYRSFPPCKASGINSKTCNQVWSRETDRSGDYNISGVDWNTAPQGLVVMAEVPCSSSEGGIMCQIKGYIVSVPGGRILKQMTARKLKKQWQPSMAFEMQVPPPPEYGPRAHER